MRGLVFLCFCTSNAIIFVPILSRECERNFCNFLKQNEGFFVIRIFFLLISNVKAKFYIEHIEMRNKKFNLKQKSFSVSEIFTNRSLQIKKLLVMNLQLLKKKNSNSMVFFFNDSDRSCISLFLLYLPSNQNIQLFTGNVISFILSVTFSIGFL